MAFVVINVIRRRYSALLKLFKRCVGTGPEDYNKGNIMRIAILPCPTVYP